MCLGIIVGYLLKQWSKIGYISKSIMFTILTLLFFLGVETGSNKDVINNLNTLGLQALIIAIAASFGSAIAAYFVYKYLNKK